MIDIDEHSVARAEIERLDQELLLMFDQVELSLVKIFGDISGWCKTHRGSSVSFRDQKLLIAGVPYRDASMVQRIAAAKTISRLIDDLASGQRRLLKSMEEALESLQELMEAVR